MPGYSKVSPFSSNSALLLGLMFVANFISKIKASDEDIDYTGYFNDQNEQAYLVEAEERWIRDQFMDRVPSQCNATERSIDLSKIFGDHFCRQSFFSDTYLIDYSKIEVNSLFRQCVCDLLTEVNDEYYDRPIVQIMTVLAVVCVAAMALCYCGIKISDNCKSDSNNSDNKCLGLV